ncbi:MAG: hypothetical protein WAL50_07970 [Kineosporiaceae bacterium]
MCKQLGDCVLDPSPDAVGLEGGDRGVECGAGGTQLGEDVDGALLGLAAQDERADALAGFDESVVDQQVLGLADRVQPGDLIVLHQSQADLDRVFFLDDEDRALVDRRWWTGAAGPTCGPGSPCNW